LEKRLLGYSYKAESYILQLFDKFIIDGRNCDDGVLLSQKLVEEWSIQSQTEGINNRHKRVAIVGQLAKYMLSLGVEAYIPPPLPKIPPADPYILNISEIQAFLEEVDNFQSRQHKSSLQRAMYSVLFRLYICCGLRLSEGVNLKKDKVDLKNGILYILHSKGDKDRKVFMAPELTKMCQNYDLLVKTSFQDRIWFFVSNNVDKPLDRSTVEHLFRRFWASSGKKKEFGKNPSVHSLRHTYVVMCMNKWLEEGKDINNLMPYLTRQLGHSSINHTNYYFYL
jgi:integrase